MCKGLRNLLKQSSLSNFNSLFNVERPKIIYHYTSANGLLGILTNRELWATEGAYLNDTIELQYADKMVDSFINKYRSDTNVTKIKAERFQRIVDTMASFHSFSTLIASFSETGDLLSQWRAYCPAIGGYALGFDTTALQHSLSAPFSFTIAPCIYDRILQRRLISELFKYCNSSVKSDKDAGTMFDVFYRYLRVVLKHPSFAEEREWRLFSLDDPGMFKGLRFRSSGSLIIPYFALPFSATSVKFPLREIVVGPCKSPNLVSDSVERLLENLKIDGVSVVISSCSFRVL